ALLFVPSGKRGDYEGKTGWQYFAKVYEGRFVNEITPTTSEYKDMTFISVDKGDGAAQPHTAILAKSKTSTEDVVIPGSVILDDVSYAVAEIDKSAFSSSSNLKNITIPEHVTKIGDGAFSTCTQLTNIICKVEEPISISSSVFPDVPAALYVPDKEKYSSSSAANWNTFSPMYNGERGVGTNDVLNLTYEYATGEQDARLIKGASTVADVTIDSYVPKTEGKKVTAIAASAFTSSKNLTTLVIPEGVETIGAGAFKGCGSLQKLTLPSSLKEIGEEAFADSKKLSVIYCGMGVSETETLFSINSNVFSSEITPTIYIPLGDEVLDAYKMTSGWDRFAANYVTGEKLNGSDEKYPSMVFEYLTGYGTATLIKVNAPVPDDKTISIPEKITIDNGEYTVTAVGGNVFKDNEDKSKIEKLVISDAITKIGDNAFQGLNGLQTVTFSSKSKLSSIGVSAFSGVSKLEELHLPSGVETIGTSAFQSCSSLKKVWLPANLTEIGKQAFDGCSKLTHVSIDAMTLPSTSSEFVPENSSALLFVPSGKRGDY
ncbi:MAG: leucine-rich repeat domain-containing protein, partial [Mogibacterium sp.]|nr:leucine-rich repeat domain-containing protein [Mogibacterium sp.]